MHPQEIRKQKQTSLHKVAEQTIEKEPVTLTPQFDQPLQQKASLQQTQDDQLTAWAVEQSGRIAIPTETILVSTKTEKKLFKSPTVTPVYGKEDFQQTRIKSLKKAMPELYAKQGTQCAIDATSKEVDLTMGNRLENATAPELVLLRKLTQGQKDPSSVNLIELRRDTMALGLDTGEDAIPLENAFTPAEQMVLMTANLCTALHQRMRSKSSKSKDLSSAKTAIESLFHTTNAYANIIIGKVFKEKQPELQREQQEEEAQKLKNKELEELRQKELAEKEAIRKLKEQAAAEVRMVGYRKANLSHLSHFLTKKTQGLPGMIQEKRVATLKKQLVTAMSTELNHSHLNSDDATQAFDQILQSKLEQCPLYLRAIQMDTEMKALLGRYKLDANFQQILRNDDHFIQIYLDEDNPHVIEEHMVVLLNTLNQVKLEAHKQLEALLPAATLAQREDLIGQLSQKMPQLFLSKSQDYLTRQLQLMARFHTLYLPHQGQRLTLNKAKDLNVPTTPLSTRITEKVLSMRSNSIVNNYLPEGDVSAHLEEEILHHLARTKGEISDEELEAGIQNLITSTELKLEYNRAMSHVRNRITTEKIPPKYSVPLEKKTRRDFFFRHNQKKSLQKGADALQNMNTVQQSQLVENLQYRIRNNGVSLSFPLQGEEPLLWQRMFGYILDGTYLEDMEVIAKEQRAALSKTKEVRALSSTLELLNPIPKDGSTMTTDFMKAQYNTDSKPELRYVTRCRNLPTLLTDLKLAEPERYYQFMLDTIGSEKLNTLGHKEYIKKVTDMVPLIIQNQKATEAFMSELETDKAYKVLRRNRNLVLNNLRPLMVSQAPAQFAKTLEQLKNQIGDPANSQQLNQMQALRKSRLAKLQRQYPTLRSQDLRSAFAGESAHILLCSPGESAWQEYANTQMSRIVPVLQLIDEKFSMMVDVPDQLRLQFHHEIFAKTMSVKEAEGKFNDHYKEMMGRTLKKRFSTDKKISKSTAELLESVNKDQDTKVVLTNYFNPLLEECTLAQVLDMDKTWKERHQTISAQVLGNDSATLAFLEQQQNSSNPQPARLKQSFRLYLRSAICSMDTATFKAQLPSQWEAFCKADLKTIKSTKKAEKTMAEKFQALQDVEKHRQGSVQLMEQDEIHRQKLFALETGQKSLFQSVVEHPAKTWSSTHANAMSMVLIAAQVGHKEGEPLSENATKILSEYLSSNQDLTINPFEPNFTLQPAKTMAKLRGAVQKTKQLEQGLRNLFGSGNLPMEETLVGKAMTLAFSLYSQGQLNELSLLGNDPMDESIPSTVMSQYLQREQRIKEVSTQLNDATETALLGMDSLSLTQEHFDESVAHAVHKQTVATAMTDLAMKLLDKESWPQEHKDAILSGWLVYRHQDFMCNNINEPDELDALTKLAASDFANTALLEMLSNVSNRDLHKSYLDKGTMSSINSTSMTQTEQAVILSMNRDGFESWLEENASKSQQKAYNILSREERQLFSFGLSMPNYLLAIQNTLVTDLVKQSTPEDGQQQAMKTLEAFILTGDTSGLEVLDYQRAKESLVATESIFGVRNKTFQSALDFTTFCIQARKHALPLDTQRLTDSQSTIQLAGNPLAPLQDMSVQGLQNFLVEPTTGLSEDLSKKVKRLDDNQMLLMINLLQNRTLIDHSCMEGETGYVDQEQRNHLIGEYSSDLALALMAQSGQSATIEGAYTALHSYQIQDGIQLGEKLQKTDLKKGALERTTAVDAALLQEAIQLVESIYEKSNKIQAMRNAPKLIAESGNQKAMDAYSQFSNHVHTQVDFQGFVQTQIQTQISEHKNVTEGDAEALGLLAALESFTQKERDLFFRALGSRDMLDVSKENIGKSRFGFAQRDYANAVARNQLLEEFTYAGDVCTEPEMIEKAFASLLSTQVADNVANEDVEGQGGADLMKSKRSTAIDWKLFKRAVQLVRRAGKEKTTRDGQRELYAAAGNVHTEGDFHFESKFLRRNLHNAGSRVTRFLGRRLASKTVGKFTGDLVEDNVSNILGNIISNKLESATEFDQLEEVQELSKEQQLKHSQSFSDLMQKSSVDMEVFAGHANAAFADYITVKESGKLGFLDGGISTDILDTITDAASVVIDTVGHAVKIKDAAVNMSKLKETKETFDAGEEARKQVRKTATCQQTEEEQQVYKDAESKLIGDLTHASAETKLRQVDTVVESVGEIVGSVMGSDFLAANPIAQVVGSVINEAAKVINFARAAFHEKEMVDESLKADELWATHKGDLTAQITQISGQKVKTYDFALAYSGFENMTEYASAMGTDFVQSLLFAASRFNDVPNTKILARTILTMLNIQHVSENYTTLNADLVFDRLMGGKNR